MNHNTLLFRSGRILILTWLLASIGIVHHTTGQHVNEESPPREKNESMFKYKGIEASFGLKSFLLKSRIPEINNLQVIEEGGSAAFVCGNSYNRLVVKVAGLYYSTSATRRTIDLFEVELSNNLYLLKALHMPAKKAEVYLLTGMSSQSLRFYGHYINETERRRKSRAGREPFLGKINNININLGLGTEYKLENDTEFIHFFIEAKTIFHLNSNTDIALFKDTRIQDFYAVNLGVRFGRIK